MALVNYATREINAKIVYYGPGLSGKTTNIQHVFAKVQPRNKGKLISLSTQGDRTLFFDFLPVELGKIKGFKTRFHLYTVPGQVFYNSTRKLVLKGADGVVFVADSQKMMMDENLQSLENLKGNLTDMGINFDTFPVVIQYNKRDLPNAAPVEEMDGYLNPLGFPYFEASAINGEGVLKTLTAIVKFILHDLKETQAGQDVDFEAIEEKEAPRPALVSEEAETPDQAPVPDAVQGAPATPEFSAPRIVLKPNRVSIMSADVPHQEELHAEPLETAEVLEEPAPAGEAPDISETLVMPRTYVERKTPPPPVEPALPEVDPALFSALGLGGDEGRVTSGPAPEEAAEVPDWLAETVLHEEGLAWASEPVPADTPGTSEPAGKEKDLSSKFADTKETTGTEAPACLDEKTAAGEELPWDKIPEEPLFSMMAGRVTGQDEAALTAAPEEDAPMQTFMLPVRLTTADGFKEVTLKVTVGIEVGGVRTGSIEKVEVLQPVLNIEPSNREPSAPVKKTSDESKLKPPEPARPERPKQASVPISKPKAEEKKLSVFHKILGRK